MRERKKKKLIIFSLLGSLLLMTVGYAAFQTNLKIKGTSGISSNWDILITNVTEANKTGDAEEAKAPTWDKLTAFVEANLYQKGDSIEYDVTVENRGTIDAKLENVTNNIKSKNEAVLVSITGYTKGEKLLKGTSQIIKVKIEYNPEFEGTAELGSTETNITLNYNQAEGGTITPTNDYLLTYDYSTNGGKNSDASSEYVTESSEVDLNPIAEKEGYEFVGWNTDKDAKEALDTLSMPSENTTLYAIYKKTLNVTYNETDIENSSCSMYNNEESCEITLPVLPNTDKVFEGWYSDNELTSKIEAIDNKYNIKENITLYPKYTEDNLTLSLNTSKTTNSITVVASAEATSEISKYEFSNDGGSTWIDNETNNVYTFEKLSNENTYSIIVRVTSGIGNTKTETTTVTLDTIPIPTYSETGTTTKTVTITYPAGCGSKYTCTYKKDSGSEITVTSTTASVSFTASGTLVGKVSDEINTVSSSYNVKIEKYTIYRDESVYRSGTGYVTGVGSNTSMSYAYYAINNNGKYTIYRDSGAVYGQDVVRTGTGYATGVGSDSNYAYYAINNNGKYTTYRDSGAVYGQDVISSGTGYTTGVALESSGNTLYYAVNDTTAGTYSINYKDGSFVRTATSGTGYVTGVALDSSSNTLYYAVNNTTAGTYSINYKDGSFVRTATSGTGYATGVALNSYDYVYYAVNNTSARTYSINYIYGGVRTYASGTGYATGVAVGSSNNIYYAVNN